MKVFFEDVTGIRYRFESDGFEWSEKSRLRGIISAVARCAWADLAASKCLGRDKDGYEECIANAKAWAEWGCQ